MKEIELFSHLEMLANLSKGFLETLDLKKTLQNAIEHIALYLHAEASSLFLVDEEDGRLICQACMGPVDILGFEIPKDHGIAGRIMANNHGEIISDVTYDRDFQGLTDSITGFVTRSILCAPITVQKKPIGIIQMLNKKGGNGYFDHSDLILLETLGAVAGLAVVNVRMTAFMVEQERLHRDVELAARIQKNLLPNLPSPDFPIHGLNYPARMVSGDFYDFTRLVDGRICFAIADVTGKGINAALLMVRTSSLFHNMVKFHPEPGFLLQAINSELLERPTRGMFVTMVAGILDPQKGTVRIANAGHEPPLFVAKNGELSEFPAQETPLAILPHNEPYPESEIELNGGALYLYTDGVTEGILPDGSDMGIDRLKQRILRLRSLSLVNRLAAIVAPLFLSSRALHDDLTLLVVQDPATLNNNHEEMWDV